MTTRRTDAAGAARAFDALARALDDPDELVDAIGLSATAEINARAGRTGSPRQAHLLAGTFHYQDATIRLAGYAQAGHGTAGELVFGAELGSDVYRQFGPRRSGGAWLFPTVRQLPSNVLADAERGLDEVIGDAL